MATYYELHVNNYEKTGRFIDGGDFSRADLVEEIDARIGESIYSEDGREREARKSDFKIVKTTISEERPAMEIIDCEYCGERPATHSDGYDKICRPCAVEFELNISAL